MYILINPEYFYLFIHLLTKSVRHKEWDSPATFV